MDPLLQPILRIATENRTEPVSHQQAREEIDQFLAEYKARCAADFSMGGAGQDMSGSGGVLISQLINLRDGLRSE